MAAFSCIFRRLLNASFERARILSPSILKVAHLFSGYFPCGPPKTIALSGRLNETLRPVCSGGLFKPRNSRALGLRL